MRLELSKTKISMYQLIEGLTFNVLICQYIVIFNRTHCGS